MADEKIIIRNLLGINQASTPVQTTSSIIGGLLFGTGFLNALSASKKQQTYSEATADTQTAVNAILPTSESRAAVAQAGLNADLAGYQAKTEAGIKQGLINRGITDAKVGEASTGAVRAGLSGAYAAARAALTKAKVNASGAVSGALSSYKQQLAQKQYESEMSKYYSQMGIWGALGGTGTSLMMADQKRNKNIPQKESSDSDSSGDSDSDVSIIEEPRSPIRTDERGSV